MQYMFPDIGIALPLNYSCTQRNYFIFVKHIVKPIVISYKIFDIANYTRFLNNDFSDFLSFIKKDNMKKYCRCLFEK